MRNLTMNSSFVLNFEPANWTFLLDTIYIYIIAYQMLELV